MKPNVILINIDDLGYGDLGCYGSEINDSPHIDKLAEDGMRFTDFYAPAPICTPSRAGLMTGCYPKRIDCQEFGVYDFKEPTKQIERFPVLLPGQPEGLNPKEKTIANLFKDAGYATKLIGKWHLGDQSEYSPLHFGFDSYLGIPYSNDMGLQPNTGTWERLGRTLCPLPLMHDRDVIEEQPDQTSLTERYTIEAVQYIRHNRDKPFFLYFAHMYVHSPLFVQEFFTRKSRNGMLGAAIHSIDWSIGLIMYELKTLGLDENTMVAFISDNGGSKLKSSNKPLRGFKGSTWEGGMRVPCIIRWPGTISGGSVCSELTTMMDFYATFTQILNIDIDDGIKRDGYSMAPFFDHKNNVNSRYPALFYYSRNELKAVRCNQFKYHIKTGELFNLHTDISEIHNIADQHNCVVKQMKALAAECRNDLGDALTGDPGRCCRPKGFVPNFKPLTYYRPDFPYIVSEYE
jgi:arylsulfatase A-like enzyme